MGKPNWYRLPKKKKEKKVDPNIRRRPKKTGPDVLYMSKSTYKSEPAKPAFSSDELLASLNEMFNLKLSNDVDNLISEIYKRGWKISTLELNKDSKYLIRFFREVGDTKSRIFTEKGDKVKKIVLRALEKILSQEKNRYEIRMRSSRKK
jgi:hypothetical protein